MAGTKLHWAHIRIKLFSSCMDGMIQFDLPHSPIIHFYVCQSGNPFRPKQSSMHVYIFWKVFSLCVSVYVTVMRDDHIRQCSILRRTTPTNKQTTENSSHTHFKKIKQTLQWQCFSAFTVNCWNLCLNMQTLNCVFFRLAVRLFFLVRHMHVFVCLFM